MLTYHGCVSDEQSEIIFSFIKRNNLLHFNPELKPQSTELYILYEVLLRELGLIESDDYERDD
jgi:hypothetical protein